MNAILDSAEELLRSGGVEALTAGAVADRVGLARNSLYRYVDSVEQMRAAVVERHLPEMFDRICQAVKSAPTPEAALAAYVESNVRIAADEDHGWLMNVAEGLEGETPERISEMHEAMMVEVFSVLKHFDAQRPMHTGELINGVITAGFKTLERGDDVDDVIERCTEAVLAIARARQGK